MDTIKVETIGTTPYGDQNAGTSGLRKKVDVFKQKNYLANFAQSIFDCFEAGEKVGKILVVSGDGRYYNMEATQQIIRIAAGNGVRKVVVGQKGLLSTPAVSTVIREFNAKKTKAEEECMGGIILTASHNPGGPKGDFGIKYNAANGGPALESFTAKVFGKSKEITEIKMAALAKEEIPIHEVGVRKFGKVGGFPFDFELEVISPTELYFQLQSKLFDFAKIRKFLKRKDFSMVLDGMSGVAGIYAQELFLKIFGLTEASLLNCVPKEDFDGGHPDPNLTYAEKLVQIMGLSDKHPPGDKIPDFGAACDGDADRNMVMGRKFFVTPSDSLAIITANYKAIPYFAGGLKGLARSMPTSEAINKVATKFGVSCEEVPTGWKFFGNLMDAGKLSICGEESFGTGSDHIREKDGLWAVLAWLSILADKNKDTPEGSLISVEAIVREHWKEFGRNYYSRYDYENMEIAQADKVFEMLMGKFEEFTKEGHMARVFEYTDKIDGSVSKNQGLIFTYSDGSRFVFRKSGTGTVGATIRIYLERYSKEDLALVNEDALKEIVKRALEYSNINAITGRSGPTVIT